ncbi:HAD family hydrolase [Halopiger aswanensis]|uniref:Putative hydrolase of the HAD superfamily n=1 Tax=Halopiger aswanensis TaxID=148449 RepID=A0A3R7EHP8_9EURY|nr:HAD family hydrolase [Halopiger aswanensis]RKD97991.1 putative hydrolase of the HAD superfamily [Halopiger aswanensis]
MSRIEAVSFDLDNTLLRYERSPGEVLRLAFETVGVDPLFSVDNYYDRYDEFAQQCDSMGELRSACFAALAAENGYERRLGRAVADAFRAERDQSNVELFPSVPDVLETLSRRYRLAVITNGAPDAQREKIDATGLERWIDTVVIAGHEIPPKPSPKPFERALRALDASSETAVHVGDSLETDVRGAAAAGLESVWVAADGDAGNDDPTYRVEGISELSPPPWTG